MWRTQIATSRMGSIPSRSKYPSLGPSGRPNRKLLSVPYRPRGSLFPLSLRPPRLTAWPWMRRERAPPPSCYLPQRRFPCPQSVFVQHSRTSTSAVAHLTRTVAKSRTGEVLYILTRSQSRGRWQSAHNGALRWPPPTAMVFYAVDSPLMVNFIMCRGLVYGNVNAV